MTTQIATAVSLACALVGCDNPAKGKSKAQVGEAKPAPAPSAPTLLRYTIAPTESQIAFVGSKVTGKHEGSFGRFAGTVQVIESAKPETSRVSIDIETESVTTDAEKLTGHLKSPDFFDVAKYPKATFTSTEIRAGGEKGKSHTIVGNLALHGVQKSISFPADVTVAPDTVTANAEFWINRKDFGIVYPGMPDDLIRDEVVIKLAIRAPRAH